MLLIRVESITQ